MRRVLKPNELKPWLKERWVIPPDADGEFAWRMEDVLRVCERPTDPARPVLCLDETSKQLVAETRAPLPAAPGRVARHDDEDERRGVAGLFLVCEPRQGWRRVVVRERRPKRDLAHVIKELVDIHDPAAQKIVLVQDNLNTHTPAALYETFPPAEAKRRLDWLELHFTPTHGSWLNTAEVELAVLTKPVLSGRIPDAAPLRERVTAWFTTRTARRGPIRWRVTTGDARIQLVRLSPVLEEQHSTGGTVGSCGGGDSWSLPTGLRLREGEGAARTAATGVW